MYYWLTVFSPSTITFSLGSLSSSWKYPHWQKASCNDFRGPSGQAIPLPSRVSLSRQFLLAPTFSSKRLLRRLGSEFRGQWFKLDLVWQEYTVDTVTTQGLSRLYKLCNDYARKYSVPWVYQSRTRQTCKEWSWGGIVSCISLSMKRYVESQLNNSGKGKNRTGRKLKLCSLSELLYLII